MRQATVSEARGWCWAVFALGHLLTGCSNDSGDVGAIPDGLASQVTLGAMQTSFVGDFDGFLFKAACGDGGTGFDCLNSINTCSDGQQTEFLQDFPMGGKAGTIYDVTVRIRGVVELKNYNNDVRAAGVDAWAKALVAERLNASMLQRRVRTCIMLPL